MENSDIPENKIDAIITDPPYGSNVQYLELSHFWYVWNEDLYPRKKPQFSKEAVTNRKKNFKGAKSYYEYEENLFKVFSKAFRVLKPEKYMALTFNNRDMNAWFALLISISVFSSSSLSSLSIPVFSLSGEAKAEMSIRYKTNSTASFLVLLININISCMSKDLRPAHTSLKRDEPGLHSPLLRVDRQV